MQILHNDRQEEGTYIIPIQQSQETDSKSNMSNGRWDCAPKSDTPRSMIIRTGHNSRKVRQGPGQND